MTALSPSLTTVTQPNVGGVMNLLDTGGAFVVSVADDANSIQVNLLNASFALAVLPTGLITDPTVLAVVAALSSQLSSLGTGSVNSLKIHLISQLSNLTSNLTIASAQASAQIGLLAQGGSLPSAPPITAANPTGNMEALFGSIMGLGTILIDTIAGIMTGVLASIASLTTVQPLDVIGIPTDIPGALASIATSVNSIAGTAGGIAGVVDSEITAMASALSDLILFSASTAMMDLIAGPCAQTLLGSIGSPALLAHLNITGNELTPPIVTPLWAYPVAAAPAPVNDFSLAPVPNSTALIDGVIAPTFGSPPTSDSLTFSWTNPTTGNPPWTFQPQYRVSGDTAWISYGGPTTAFSVILAGLDANTQYDLQLLTTNSLGSSTSPIIIASTLSAIIGAPSPATNLTLGLIDTNSIALSWTAPFGGDIPVIYQVRYRATGAYFWNDFGAPIGNLDVVLTGLNTNSLYDLVVISINDVGTSTSTVLSTATLGFAIITENPTPLPTPPPTPYPTLPTPITTKSTLPLGAYVGAPNSINAEAQAQFVAQFQSFGSAMGRNPTLLNTYIDSALVPATWASLGAQPIVAAWRGTSFLQPGLMLPVLGLPMFSSGVLAPTTISPTPSPTIHVPTPPTSPTPSIPTSPTPTTPTTIPTPSVLAPPQLPTGYFLTAGSQIITFGSLPVRICAVCWQGADLRNKAPLGLNSVNYQTLLARVQAAGFNCIRILTNDAAIFNNDPVNNINIGLNPSLQGMNLNQVLIAIVDFCAVIGLRVIFDSHNNEGFGGAQKNGLWYDVGGTSGGHDGAGHAGTITDATFLEVWRTRASLFKNKPAILGYDLRNVPQSYAGLCTWGDGGINDLQAMYTRVGNAIQAIDSGPLIICAGPENYNTTFVGTGSAPSGDLTLVQNFPVNLTIPFKVVYTVHEYPDTVAGSTAGADNGADYIARMQAAWGYLVSNKIAPVWVSECGCSMQDPTEKAWGNTFISYINGMATGGPAYLGNQQGIGLAWWDLEPITGVGEDQFGIITDWTASSIDPVQKSYWGQTIYTSKGSGVIPPVVPTPTVPTVAPTVPIPTQPTPIVPTVVLVVSPNGTIMTGTTNRIIDSSFNSWSLQTSGSNFAIFENGVQSPAPTVADFMLYLNGTMYYELTENGAPVWWLFNGSAWPLCPDPRTISQSTTVLAGTSGSLIDSALNVWSLEAANTNLTTTFNIYENGVLSQSPTVANLLLYYNGIIYYEITENGGQVWYMASGNTWILLANDPRIPPTVPTPTIPTVPTPTVPTTLPTPTIPTPTGTIDPWTIDFASIFGPLASPVQPTIPTPTVPTPTVPTPTVPTPTRPTPTVPTVPTPTVPTPTTYITPGVGSFQDGSGNTYTLDATGVAMENGSPIPGGAGTAAMDYYNGLVYGQDQNTLGWYTWDGTNWNGPVTAPIITPTNPTTPTPTSPTVPTTPTPSGTRVVAPLTGGVSTGSWVLGNRLNVAAMPHGFIAYDYLLPHNYNTNVVYPLLVYGHENTEGSSGTNYPNSTIVFQPVMDGAFNTVIFRTAHPCIVVVPYCDQTDQTGGTGENFGGYQDTANSGGNEQGVTALAQHFIASFSVDPTRIYCTGDSLGGIGSLAWMVDNSRTNGQIRLWTAGMGFADQMYRPANGQPNNTTFTNMTNVPYIAVSQTSDGNSSTYDQPAWQFYTGNSNYPSQAQYDNGGVAAIKAGSSSYYYINYTGNQNSWDAFRQMNGDGGDGTALYALLFSFVI
jgi:endoglucanase